jgi:alpha-tubulin suppressor-like RCC1 family protein
MAIRNDGLLFAWGFGGNGQVGDGTAISRSSPVQIGSGSWTSIRAGTSHSLAIRNDGLLFAWGYGSVGQIGDGTTISRSSPVQIGSSSWTSISAGTNHSLAVRNDGLLFAWGNALAGQVGDGTTIGRSSPVQIGSSSWTSVGVGAAGASHSLAVRNDGLLFAWGLNSLGALGNNDSVVYPKKAFDSFVAIGAGAGFALAIQAA